MKRMLIFLSGIATAAYLLVTGLSAAGAHEFPGPGGAYSVVAEDKGPTIVVGH